MDKQILNPFQCRPLMTWLDITSFSTLVHGKISSHDLLLSTWGIVLVSGFSAHWVGITFLYFCWSYPCLDNCLQYSANDYPWGIGEVTNWVTLSWLSYPLKALLSLLSVATDNSSFFFPAYNVDYAWVVCTCHLHILDVCWWSFIY